MVGFSRGTRWWLGALSIAIVALVVGVSAAGATPPTVTVSAAQPAGSADETLSGTVNARACRPSPSHGTWTFEYATDNGFDPTGTDELTGQKGRYAGGASPNPLGSFDASSSSDQPVTTTAHGLSAGVLYHYRLVAENSDDPGNPQPCSDGTSGGWSASADHCFEVGHGDVPCPVRGDVKVHLLDRRGISQVAYVAVLHNHAQQSSPVDANGDVTVNVQPGDTIIATRSLLQHSGPCMSPEGDIFHGVRYEVPPSPPASVTLTLPNATGPSFHPELSRAERGVVGRINQMRASRGLAPLHISTTLDRVADATAHDAALIEQTHGHYPWPPKYCDAVAIDWGWPQPYTPGVSGLDAPTTSPAAALAHWTDGSARAQQTFSKQWSAVGIGDGGGGAWILYLSSCDEARNPAAARCEMTSDAGDAAIRLPASAQTAKPGHCAKQKRRGHSKPHGCAKAKHRHRKPGH